MKFFRACVFLLLVLCQVAPAVALMLPPPVTCGMECCIESGVECCVTKDPLHDGASGTKTALKTIAGPPCPSQCAMLPAGFKPVVLHRSSKTSTRVLLGTPVAEHRKTVVLVREPLVSGPNAPRSPPTP